jgi:hypothetical protein
MALQRPYITNKFISYEGDKIFTDLSIAIQLIDDYTGEETGCAVKVVIKKGNIKSYKNPSGYYIFTNLEDGNYSVDIESDLYFHEESAIDTLKIKTLDAIDLEFQSAGPLLNKTIAQLKDVSKLQKDFVIEFGNTKGETEEKSIKEIDSNNKVIKWRKGLKKHVSAFLFTWSKVPDNDEETKRLRDFLVEDLDISWVKDAINLFSWDHIPGNDNEKLINFLKDRFGINWAETANIEKIDNDKTISLNLESKFIFLKLNDDQTKASLIIDDVRTEEFVAKMENGKLKIYDALIKKIDENTIRVSKDDDSLDIALDRDNVETTIKIKDGPEYKLWTKKEGMEFKIYGGTVRAQNYIAGIILKPKPFYPFPDHATLVRGSIVSIVESKEIPVDNATVKVVDYEIETESDGNGEFVLYFNEIKNNKNNNKQKEVEIRIEIEKNGVYKTLETIIGEGKTIVLGKIVFP